MSDVNFSVQVIVDKLSVQVIADKFREYKANSNASASEILARVLNDVEGREVNPNEYKVLIAYQLLSPELSLEKLFPQKDEEGITLPANSKEDENPNPLVDTDLGKLLSPPTISLEALPVKTGYYVFFVKPGAVSTKLEINIKGRSFFVNKQDYRVGRMDDVEHIFPDLDLSQFLGKYSNKVSRELLILNEDDGKWKVRLHQNAHSRVFLDNVELKHGEEKEIGGAILVGNSPEDYYIKMKTTIIND